MTKATQHPRGLTLLEMTLVMSLLVVVFALIVPRLTGSAAARRLGLGADQVRAAWTKARNRSMLTGDTHLFLYRPGMRVFAVVAEPISQDAEMVYQRAVAWLGSVSLENEEQLVQAPTTEGFRLERLPFDVTFIDSAVIASNRALAGNLSLGGSETGSATTYIPPQGNAAVGQSAGIAMVSFRPDGTTSTSTVWLANEDEEFIPVWLRGLTGIATVGEIVGGANSNGPRSATR